MMRIPRLVTLSAFTALAAIALVTSSTLAAPGRSSRDDGVHFFEGSKTCSQSNTPPLFVCVMTGNVPLLEGASVAYTSVPAVFNAPGNGRIDSDVRLTTAGTAAGQQSTAHGHCTFYFDTGTGLCTYTGGTRNLSGFNAALVIGTNSDGSFSAIGKYWFGDDSGD